MQEIQSDLPQQSSEIFANFRKMFENIPRPLVNIFIIFGNLPKMDGNLQKIVKNLVNRRINANTLANGGEGLLFCKFFSPATEAGGMLTIM